MVEPSGKIQHLFFPYIGDPKYGSQDSEILITGTSPHPESKLHGCWVLFFGVGWMPSRSAAQLNNWQVMFLQRNVSSDVCVQIMFQRGLAQSLRHAAPQTPWVQAKSPSKIP